MIKTVTIYETLSINYRYIIKIKLFFSIFAALSFIGITVWDRITHNFCWHDRSKLQPNSPNSNLFSAIYAANKNNKGSHFHKVRRVSLSNSFALNSIRNRNPRSISS